MAEIDEIIKQLELASGHFKLTTKGYTRMAQPLPTTSQWGQGYKDYNEAMQRLRELSTPVPEPPLPTQILSGVYVGAINPGAVDSFGAMRGKKCDVAVEFGAWDSWAAIEGPSWNLDPWKGRYRLIYSVNPWPKGAGSLSRAANGEFDLHYAKLATSLKSRGMENTIIRFAWECGGDWYEWGIKSTTDAENFKKMFQRASVAIKEVCPTLLMDWNTVLMPAFDPSLSYPGDQYTDIISFDHYDQTWMHQGTPQERWKYAREGTSSGRTQYGINWFQKFAKDHGKLLGVTEWGLTRAQDQDGHGGGDDPYFIDAMADLFQEGGFAYEAYFQFNAGDGYHHLDLFPNSKARYQERF